MFAVYTIDPMDPIDPIDPIDSVDPKDPIDPVFPIISSLFLHYSSLFPHYFPTLARSQTTRQIIVLQPRMPKTQQSNTCNSGHCWDAKQFEFDIKNDLVGPPQI